MNLRAKKSRKDCSQPQNLALGEERKGESARPTPRNSEMCRFAASSADGWNEHPRPKEGVMAAPFICSESERRMGMYDSGLKAGSLQQLSPLPQHF